MMNSTTIIDQPHFGGKETQRIMRSIDQHAACGYGPESAPYLSIMRGCADGSRMRDTAPFSRLGPVMWIAFAVLFALPAGMILGAASKSCACEVTR